MQHLSRWQRGAAVAAAAISVGLVGAGCGRTSIQQNSTPTSAAASPQAAGTIPASHLVGGVKVKAQTGDKPLHLAFFGLCACNPYSSSQGNGVKKALAELHDGSTYAFFDGKFDAQTQANQVQDATASGKYNAFVIMPNDGASIVAPVTQAIKQGIKIGALYLPIGPSYTTVLTPQVPGVTMTLAQSPAADGRITADRVNHICKGRNPCKIVVMLGVRSAVNEAKRRQAVDANLDKNVKVIDYCYGNYLQEGGFSCMQDALQIDHSIDVIMTPSGDEMMTGATRALTAAGIKVGNANPEHKFQIVGLAASQDAVRRVRSGQWDSSRTFLGDPTLSTIMVQSLSDNLNGRGKKWPSAYNTDLLSPIGPIATQLTLKRHPAFKGEWCC